MGTERINEIYDVQAINGQVADVVKKIERVTAAMEYSADRIAACNREIGASKSFDELTKATSRFVKINNECAVQAKELMVLKRSQVQLEEKLQASYLAMAHRISQVRDEVTEESRAIRDLVAAQREHEKANLSTASSSVGLSEIFLRQRASVAALREENVRLQDVLKSMDSSRQREEIEQINATIAVNTTLIGLNSEAYIRQRADAEKYSTVVGGLGNILSSLGKELQNVSGGINTDTFNELRSNLENAGACMAQYQARLETLRSNSADLTTELEKVTAQMSLQASQGELGSDTYLALSERAGSLRDELQKVNEEIQDTKPPVGTYETILGGLTGIAGGFQTLEGVMGIFNLESETFEQIQTKVQSAIVITNGLIAVKTALDERSALMTELNSLAQSKHAVISKTATIVQLGLNAAMNSFPLLLVISALVAGGVALGAWLGAAKEATEAQKMQNEVHNKSIDGYAKEKLEVESLAEKIKTGNVTRKEHAEMVKIQNKLHGESFTKNKSLKELEDQFINDAPAYVNMLKNKAQAQAAFNLAVEKEKELLQEQSKDADEYVGSFKRFLIGADAAKVLGKERKKAAIIAKEAEVQGFMEIANANKIAIQTITENNLFKNEEEIKENEKSLKAIQQLDSLKMKSAIDAQREILGNEKKSYQEKLSALDSYTQKQIAAIQNQRNFELNGVNNKDERALIVQKAEDDILKARKFGAEERKKLEKQEIETVRQLADVRSQVVIDANQQILNDDKTSYEQKIAALYTIEEEQKKSLIRRAQIEMDGLDINSSNAKLINEKLEADLTNIKEKGTQDRKALEDKEAMERVAQINNLADCKKTTLEEEYNTETAALTKKYAKGLMSKELYEQEKLNLSRKYSKDVFDVEINNLEKIVKDSGFYGKNLEDAQKALAEKKVEYNKWANAQIMASDEEFAAAKQQLTQEAYDAIFSIMNSVFERKIQQVDEEIEKLDEQKEHDLELVDEMNISDEEKAAKKQEIEARAEVEKGKLEKKKKKLQLEQAKLEKAQALINVAINTAVGVVAAWSNPWAAPALIPVIIATGAVQAAVIAAQPLPQYAQGTEDHPGGLAIVGDGGKKELVKTSDGTCWITPDTPTLVDLPKHAEVLPDFNQVLRYLSFTPIIRDDAPGQTERIEQRLKVLEKAIKETTAAVIQSRSQLNVHLDKKGIWSTYEQQKGRINYLNERLNIQR